jgi:uncharacterized protein
LTAFPKTPASTIDPSRLKEPVLSAKRMADYERGWDLFNAGEYWHAHEAWEQVWKECEAQSRIFFQGIIQLAAACHLLLQPGRYNGMMRNLSKAEEKLHLFPDTFLRVDVRELERHLARIRAAADVLGPHKLHAFDRSILPIISLRP